MALTIKDVGGAHFSDSPRSGPCIRAFDVTFDNAYLTGGLALSASDMRLTTVLFASMGHDDTTGNISVYNYATGKLKAFTAVGVEVGNGVDLSAVTVRLLAFGTAF